MPSAASSRRSATTISRSPGGRWPSSSSPSFSSSRRSSRCRSSSLGSSQDRPTRWRPLSHRGDAVLPTDRAMEAARGNGQPPSDGRSALDADELALALLDLGFGRVRLFYFRLDRRDRAQALCLTLALQALPLFALMLRPAHAEPPRASCRAPSAYAVERAGETLSKGERPSSSQPPPPAHPHRPPPRNPRSLPRP